MMAQKRHDFCGNLMACVGEKLLEDFVMQDNSAIWSGRAMAYATYRPQPPTVIIDMFTQLIQQRRPSLVVDLGSGTGLSTILWAGRAKQVLGVEPNADMLRQAEELRIERDLTNVGYRAARSTATGLDDRSADIVTCSQALHWMEPDETFAEVARILRPGGLFAAYDYDWPPTLSWQAEEAFRALMERVDTVSNAHGIKEGATRWSKDQHLARMKASGRFRYVREVLLHHQETGNAERFIGLALSNHISALIKNGLRPEDIDVDGFTSTVKQAVGDEQIPFWFSYRVRLGIV
jgi:ubiquinone/menaquinone biosynthesis C-methylase UbiE